MVNGVVVAIVVVAPVGFERVLRLMLRLVRKPWLRPTLSSGLPNSRPLSKYMPYPARTEVRPSPLGSHAMPRRGSNSPVNFLANSCGAHTRGAAGHSITRGAGSGVPPGQIDTPFLWQSRRSRRRTRVPRECACRCREDSTDIRACVSALAATVWGPSEWHQPARRAMIQINDHAFPYPAPGHNQNGLSRNGAETLFGLRPHGQRNRRGSDPATDRQSSPSVNSGSSLDR